MILKKIYIPILSFLFLLSSCSYEKNTLRQNESREDYYLIWALSDIQPRTNADREAYETSISDVKNHLPRIDMAIMAGDIVHRRKAVDDYRWYLKENRRSGIKEWYEIAGNHDMKDLVNYKKFIKKPLHYSVQKGNLLILFMSDEDRFPPTYISDKTFRWWKNMVINNQDKIIITVTHAYPENSKLFMAKYIESRTILKSKRFEDVLRIYRVDLWLAGHTHIPSAFGFNESRIREFKNCTFMNISRIRRDMHFNPESRIIILKNNSSRIVIKNRDHDEHDYVKRREVIIKSPIRFKFNQKVKNVIVNK